jgi:RNA polymerase sigma-70 factor (ECF subfamily)
LIVVSTPTAQALLPIPFIRRKSPVMAHRAEAPGEIAVLTRGLVAGGEEAFRRFHALYFDRLYQFLLVVSRGHEDEAQEALQQTLLRVVRYARVFDMEEQFWSWLKVLARCAARDAGRKRQRYSTLLQNFGSAGELAQGSNGSQPETQLEALLHETLQRLDPLERRLLEGKYFLGNSVRELALQYSLTEKSVESKLLRLRRQLRQELLQKLRTQ